MRAPRPSETKVRWMKEAPLTPRAVAAPAPRPPAMVFRKVTTPAARRSAMSTFRRLTEGVLTRRPVGVVVGWTGGTARGGSSSATRCSGRFPTSPTKTCGRSGGARSACARWRGRPSRQRRSRAAPGREDGRGGTTMERLHFTLRLREGGVEEYERRHREVWPALVRDLRAAGWRNYSLFRRGLAVHGYASAIPTSRLRRLRWPRRRRVAALAQRRHRGDRRRRGQHDHRAGGLAHGRGDRLRRRRAPVGAAVATAPRGRVGEPTPREGAVRWRGARRPRRSDAPASCLCALRRGTGPVAPTCRETCPAWRCATRRPRASARPGPSAATSACSPRTRDTTDGPERSFGS